MTWWRRLTYALRRRRMEADLREEIESHRSMVQDRLERSGMTPQDAATASRRALGNATLAHEDARELWIWPSLERFWQDIRFGARMLIKQPTFTVTAIATLALGIGTTTTMVSVVNGELWRPLPFRDPGKLVSVLSLPPGPTSWDLASSAELERWRDEARTVEAVAGIGPGGGRVLHGGRVPESIRTLAVTSNFFSVLGWSPNIGRSFEPAHDAEQAAILTDGAWQRFFDGDPGVIGRTVILDEQPVQIVGVLGSDRRLEFIADPDLYYTQPVRADRAPAGSSPRIWQAIARLQAASQPPGAEDELQAIERAAHASTATTERRIRVEPLDGAFTGFNWRALYFFLGASLFVLALSCANVANLLLTRAFDRQREFAIRGALGGGRAALTRQLLAEGVWIAVPGTLAGIVIASWIAEVLAVWMPPSYLIRGIRTSLDLRACAFALAVCGITTAVFGLVPLLFNRTDLTQALTRTSRGSTGSPAQQRVRRVFVLTEIVIAFVLVFGAGLFGISFAKLRNAPLGFDPEGRLAIGLALSGDRFAAPENIVLFVQRVLEEVRSRPGVIRASVASTLPLAGGISCTYSLPDAKPVDPSGRPSGPARAVDPDYFATLGTRIVAGRAFTGADVAGAPHVAIINQTLARNLFRDGDPIGRDLVIHPRSTTWLNEERVTIVGVAENSKDVGIHAVEMSTVNVPLAQHPTRRLQLAVHTSIPASAAVESVRSAVNAADPRLPLVNVSTMQARVDSALRSNRFNLLLLGSFAAVAIVLAAIGLYGALAYATEQRLPELALRHALGADPSGLLMLVMRQAAALAVTGVTAGIGATLVLARIIGDGLYLVRGQHEGLIYGVTTTDPWTFAGAAALVTGIVVMAATVPARRAARADPVAVLRSE